MGAVRARHPSNSDPPAVLDLGPSERESVAPACRPSLLVVSLSCLARCWLMTATTPFAGGEPNLVEQQPFGSPRHNGLRDQPMPVPLVPEVETKQIAGKHVRQRLPVSSFQRGVDDGHRRPHLPVVVLDPDGVGPAHRSRLELALPDQTKVRHPDPALRE